jgi:PIN like domain
LVSSSPRDAPVFFLDRCLGKKIIAARLRTAGFSVEVHADHFPQTQNVREESDREWLRFAGAQGWVVLSKNEGIRRNQIEIVEIRDSGVAAFISTASNITGEQLADSFVAAMPRVLRIVRRHKRPYIATVSKSGRVTMFMDRTALVRRAGGSI